MIHFLYYRLYFLDMKKIVHRENLYYEEDIYGIMDNDTIIQLKKQGRYHFRRSRGSAKDWQQPFSSCARLQPNMACAGSA